MARILIADDNEAARGMLKEALQTHDGWEVCATAEDGFQAVRKAIELRPDVIVLDLAMPAMDGLAAGREIRKALPSAPILIYTLYDGYMVEQEAKKAGITQVVSKSDTLQSLISAIERLLRNDEAAAAAAASAAANTQGITLFANVPTRLEDKNPTLAQQSEQAPPLGPGSEPSSGN